jgi:hypothetical protein
VSTRSVVTFSLDENLGYNSLNIDEVVGVGMPTKDGIKAVLQHLGAGPNGKRTLYWTSLREEPVLYIKGRPYVLRLFIDPIKVKFRRLCRI